MRDADGLSSEAKFSQLRSLRHPVGSDAAATRGRDDGLLAETRAVSRKRRLAASEKEVILV